MLNRPHTLTRRRAAALALGLLGVAGPAYAAETAPQAASAPEAAPQKVEIRLDVASGEFKAKPRLITALGERSSLQWGGTGAQSWRLDFIVTRAADGKLKVLTLPRYGGKLVSQHTGLLASGEKFDLAFGGADGVPKLKMTRVVTLLPADFKMPGQTSKPRS